MQNYLFKSFSFFLLMFAQLAIAQQPIIRNYNHAKDYRDVVNICGTFKAELGEQNEYCSNEFHNALYSFVHPEQFSQKISIKIFKVAELNDKTIGFICIQGPVSFNKELAELTYIAIHKDHQSKGYGKMLLDAAIADLKNQKKFIGLTANVKKTNTAAIAWHKKCGFSEVNEQNTYSFSEEETRVEELGAGYQMLRLLFDTKQAKTKHFGPHKLTTQSFEAHKKDGIEGSKRALAQAAEVNYASTEVAKHIKQLKKHFLLPLVHMYFRTYTLDTRDYIMYDFGQFILGNQFSQSLIEKVMRAIDGAIQKIEAGAMPQPAEL